ncbi:unnamed protein product, partial [Sphacelaria rigidula]
RAAKVGHRRKSVVADDFDRFMRQRSGGAVGWENATPEQVVNYLAYKDSQGTGTKVVHVLQCPQIGTDSLVQCKELGLGCAKRYAHTSLNKQYISKLRCAYTEILANSDDWSVTEHRGNPVKSVPVTEYLAFSAAEQQKAGVATKQARPLLLPDLAAIVAAIRIQLAGTENPAESIALVRDMALFTVALRTAGRGGDLTQMMAGSVLRLPEDQGIVLNFRFTKTLREGSRHVCHVAPDRDMPDTCAVAALQVYAQAMKSCGWQVSQGFLFPEIRRTGDIKLAKCDTAMTPRAMTARLQEHAQRAGLGDRNFTMHSFRVGAAVARTIAGQDVATVMAQIGWKSSRVASRYI